MRPCTVSDRLCILPNIVTAQRPERPQTNKSEATLWRGSSGEQFRIHARNPPPNFRGVSPPEGAGGGNEPKAQQPFELQVRSIVPVVKCFSRALDCSGRSCRIIAADGQKSAIAIDNHEVHSTRGNRGCRHTFKARTHAIFTASLTIIILK